MTKASLARASGVSKATIHLWCRVPSKSPVAKELHLQVDEPPLVESKKPSIKTVCIRLRSGVEIDFPRSELSFEFMTVLNSLGGAQ